MMLLNRESVGDKIFLLRNAYFTPYSAMHTHRLQIPERVVNRPRNGTVYKNFLIGCNGSIARLFGKSHNWLLTQAIQSKPKQCK
jgi:hypothetical protein